VADKIGQDFVPVKICNKTDVVYVAVKLVISLDEFQMDWFCHIFQIQTIEFRVVKWRGRLKMHWRVTEPVRVLSRNPIINVK